MKFARALAAPLLVPVGAGAASEPSLPVSEGLVLP
jgi:hypothetical protein